MPTKLLYLSDTYCSTSEAVCLGWRDSERGRALLVDATIFYPQGGGQPADRGRIVSGESIFEVTDVRLDLEGVVHHFGTLVSGDFTA